MDRGGRTDGWVKDRHRIPRGLDFLRIFALAKVGVARVMGSYLTENTSSLFSLRDRIFPCSYVGVCSGVPELSVSATLTTLHRVYTARRIFPLS